MVDIILHPTHAFIAVEKTSNTFYHNKMNRISLRQNAAKRVVRKSLRKAAEIYCLSSNKFITFILSIYSEKRICVKGFVLPQGDHWMALSQFSHSPYRLAISEGQVDHQTKYKIESTVMREKLNRALLAVPSSRLHKFPWQAQRISSYSLCIHFFVQPSWT